jgi:hypothetical protein
MIRTSITAAALVLLAAAPSFAGPYGYDRPSSYGGYGRAYDDDGRLTVDPYTGQVTFNESAGADHCDFHRRSGWRSYGQRYVSHGYGSNDGMGYGNNVGMGYGN